MRRLHSRLVFVGLWLASASICAIHASGAEPGVPGRAQFDSARLFPLLDTNGDNRLTKEELQQLAARGEDNGSRREVFERIFTQLDTDHSGELSLTEFGGLSRLRGRTQPPTPAPVAPKAGLPKLYGFADGPQEVESLGDLVLRDEKRGKDLQLRVSFPRDTGVFPIIVWSHGATGSKDDYQPLVRHWVSYGYVCIQANHSDSRALAGMPQTGQVADKLRDWAERPKDILFILDSLDTIEAKVQGLQGKMDKKTIGVGGHSFGAHTAQLVAGTTTVDLGGVRTNHADPRPKAFVLISPQGKGAQLDDKSWEGLTRPFLSITGSNDWGRNADPVDWRLDPFKLASSTDKYLLYIEGAHHDFGGIGGGVAYRNAGPANPNHLAYVKSTTIAFWDAYLKGDAKARKWLQDEALEKETKGQCTQEQKFAGAAGTASEAPVSGLSSSTADRPDDAPPDRAALLIRRGDRDGDGALSRDESPDRLKAAFDRVDASRDGKVSREELAPLLERVQRRGGAETQSADQERFRLESKTAGSLVPTVPPAKVDGGGRQTASASRSGAGRYDFGPLDRFLEEALPRLNGGCSFILIQGDRVIHRKAYGTFTPETVVPIASASKWISGGVIMALVDEGKIGLDDKASKYLPKFKGEKAGITIRQMFSHTHGFAATPYLHRDTRLTLEEAVDKIADVPLRYEPGTHLYYSGLGMQVAGRIAEIATGKPWVEIFREQIGGPLGMDKTTYYAFGKTQNPNVAGSVETCIDDYGAFVTMVLNHGMYRGQRVLSEKAVETMLSIQSGNVPILHHPYVGYTDFDPSMAKMPYGIGCWLEQVDAATGLAWRASSGGAFGCHPFVDSKRNVAGVFLPCALNEKRSSKGIPYNDASVVYLQLRDILNTILDAGQQPSLDEKPEPPSARTDGPVPSPTAATVRPAPDADSPSETAPDPVMVHGGLAADYSAKNGGRAVLVMVGGKTAFERYDNRFGPDTATHLHSATKGFWGPVIAAMIEDGLVGSFDELASKTLPEWKEHPRKGRITLRHLLTLSAGLEQDAENLQGDDRPTLAPDLYKHAIGVQALHEPGATFQYGPSCYYVLGEIMKRKLAASKQTPLDYLKQRILDPIGVKVGDWVHDASGNPHIPNGAHLTARNWARYGQWLLQGGQWNGKQIVRKNLLDELVKPSKANAGHGLALWLNQPGGQGAVGVAAQKSEPADTAGWIYRGGHSDLFAALGAGKCRMYLIPSLKMVVVRQADSQSDRFDDNTFLSFLLTGKSPESASRRTGGGDQILRQIDRNGDGKIGRDEAGPGLRQWFDRLDKDGDGTLDMQDLRPILERRGGSH